MARKTREVRSILFPRETWDKDTAAQWLKGRGWRWRRILESSAHLRAQQRREGDFLPRKEGGVWRTFLIPDTDVKLLFGDLRPQLNPRSRKTKWAPGMLEGFLEAVAVDLIG